MKNRFVTMATVTLALLLGGCEHSRLGSMPTGDAAYAALARTPEDVADSEVIRVNDRLAIRVVGEPDLTSESYRVDGNGLIEVPLAGEIQAAGRTPRQVREEIVKRLGSRFIRDPQVAVILIERSKVTFAVEGAVREPGVYEASAASTLLTALAQAKSPTNVARLDGVMIFRVVNGQRLGARFNLVDIRKGLAADPDVLPGDTIVVMHSNAKSAWREVLQAAPLFNLFYVFR